MKIDVHFHVAGNGRDIGNADNDVYFLPEDNHYWFTRITHSILMEELEKLGADFNRDGTISTDEYFELAYSVLTASEEIDGAVLLAMDAVFDPVSGKMDEDFPPQWLVHGSDFPLPFDAWPHLPWVTHDVTPEEYLQIKKTRNPLDRDVRIKRAHGFSDSILDNTETVLGLV